jgi:hypothetical protein
MTKYLAEKIYYKIPSKKSHKLLSLFSLYPHSPLTTHITTQKQPPTIIQQYPNQKPQPIADANSKPQQNSTKKPYTKRQTNKNEIQRRGARKTDRVWTPNPSPHSPQTIKINAPRVSFTNRGACSDVSNHRLEAKQTNTKKC